MTKLDLQYIDINLKDAYAQFLIMCTIVSLKALMLKIFSSHAVTYRLSFVETGLTAVSSSSGIVFSAEDNGVWHEYYYAKSCSVQHIKGRENPDKHSPT